MEQTPAHPEQIHHFQQSCQLAQSKSDVTGEKSLLFREGRNLSVTQEQMVWQQQHSQLLALD